MRKRGSGRVGSPSYCCNLLAMRCGNMASQTAQAWLVAQSCSDDSVLRRIRNLAVRGLSRGGDLRVNG